MYERGWFKNKAHHVMSLLNLHDGEARVVQDNGYQRIPADVNIRDAKFWHYQFARSKVVRDFLFERWFVIRDRSPFEN